MQKSIPRLMLVTHKSNTPLKKYLEFIEICAHHGIDAVQLREKDMNQTELLHFGKALKKLLTPLNIALIVNDNIKLALALDADGVHLGQKDESTKRARKILGNDKLIGLSVNTLANVEKANTLPINYLGVGAIFPTHNKSDVITHWGIDGLNQVAAISQHPLIAIGGINEANAADVAETPAHGMAAIGVFHDSPNPANTTKFLHHLFVRPVC